MCRIEWVEEENHVKIYTSRNLRCDGEEYKKGKGWQTQPLHRLHKKTSQKWNPNSVQLCMCSKKDVWKRVKQSVHPGILNKISGNCILCIGLAIFFLFLGFLHWAHMQAKVLINKLKQNMCAPIYGYIKILA